LAQAILAQGLLRPEDQTFLAPVAKLA